MTARAGVAIVVVAASLGLAHPGFAQSAGSSLADLQRKAAETRAGRFVIVPGERAMIAGYAAPGFEVWAYPLQLVRNYHVSFRVDGDSAEIDGRSVMRSLEVLPTATTRVYAAPSFTIRERAFTPADLPGATISYRVESSRPVAIIVRFTPSLNLMWPGAIGGQEIHWDSTHSAYLLDEPTHRFRGAIVSRQIVAHDEIRNDRRGAEFERTLAFTLRATPPRGGDTATATVTFGGSSTAGDDPLAIAEALASRPDEYERRAHDRYAALHLLDVVTPDTAVNNALRWAQITLEQAWVCNPQLGCGLIAGYGPSRGARRPQYDWFFAGDGLVAVDALLREGAYARAREELAFIMHYQNARTGAIWHELSQSAGFLDWAGAYPYMFVHVDVSFDFLNTVRDYVETTGDVAFAREHWHSIRAAYDYARSTIPAGAALPIIPAGQQGRDEQDPQRDELTLSLAWVTAAESFAVLARATNHGALAADASRASVRARNAIRPTYYDAHRGKWVSGHLRSGAPVEGLTSSSIALLHHGMLGESERRTLLDELASPSYRAPWGIRSSASDAPLYDPDSYARGSVWALGTADAIMAFHESGRSATASSLWRDLVGWFAVDSPGHMHEVMAGNAFVPQRESVPDQTWSAASFISSAVRGMLGLQVDAVKRAIRFAPQLPPEWDSLHVRRLSLGGADVALALRTSPDVVELVIENSGAPATLTFRPALAPGVTVHAAQVGDQSLVEARRGEPYEITVTCPSASLTRITLHLARPPG